MPAVSASHWSRKACGASRGEVADLRGAHLGDAVAVQVDAVAFRQQQVARAFAQRLDPDRLGQAHVALQRLVGARRARSRGVQLRAVFAGAVEHMGEAQLVFRLTRAAVFQLGGAEVSASARPAPRCLRRRPRGARRRPGSRAGNPGRECGSSAAAGPGSSWRLSRSSCPGRPGRGERVTLRAGGGASQCAEGRRATVWLRIARALASLAFAVGGLVGQAPLRRAVGRLGAVQALGVDQFHVALHRAAVEQQPGTGAAAERHPTSRRWPGAAGSPVPTSAGWRRGPGAGRGWRRGRAGRSATARPPAAAGGEPAQRPQRSLRQCQAQRGGPAARHRAAAPGCRAAVRRDRDDGADTGRAVAGRYSGPPAPAGRTDRRRARRRAGGPGRSGGRGGGTVPSCGVPSGLAGDCATPGRWSRRPCKAAGERPSGGSRVSARGVSHGQRVGERRCGAGTDRQHDRGCHRSCAQPVARGEPDPLRRVRRGDPEARRRAIPGVRLCVNCQAEHDREQAKFSGYNRRGSKDSQLR